MNWQHLMYFETIAKEQHFTRAAKKLYITQPTLSRAISNLESELSVPLFEKNGRSTKLTKYGTEFLKYVTQAKDNIEKGIECLQTMGNVVEGDIRISCIYGYAVKYLAELIRNFSIHNPKVKFHMKQLPTRAIIQEMHECAADIGFLCDTAILKNYDDLEHFLVKREKIVLVVAKEHPLAKLEAISLPEIQNENFISHDETSGMLYRVREMFEEQGLVFRPCLQASDPTTMLGLVRNRVGLAFVFENSAKSNSDLAALELEGTTKASIDILMTLKKREFYAANVRAFKNYILEATKESI